MIPTLLPRLKAPLVIHQVTSKLLAQHRDFSFLTSSTPPWWVPVTCDFKAKGWVRQRFLYFFCSLVGTFGTTFVQIFHMLKFSCMVFCERFIYWCLIHQTMHECLCTVRRDQRVQTVDIRDDTRGHGSSFTWIFYWFAPLFELLPLFKHAYLAPYIICNFQRISEGFSPDFTKNVITRRCL